MPASISIVTHELSAEMRGSRYFVAQLAALWERQGLNVNATAGCRFIPAELALMHVDTSLVGEEYLSLGHRYPLTLNGRVEDIRKTSISDYLLKKDDAYSGPVIVKTNENYGGLNEFRMRNRFNESIIPPSFIDRPWRKREIMDSLNYPVFEKLADVPSGVWKNPRLIVEKFLPERLDNGDYKGRVYLFFGREEFVCWFSSPKPVIKSTVATDKGVLDSVPPALRHLRTEHGFDFGKFDYTEVDGEVCVYDMNKTPAFGPEMRELITQAKMEKFAQEVHEFL
jgi:hypothetical protein